MATRRDELSAHTFARKRTLAAFLQPESRVSDEEAPRPVRAMMPSIVVGVVLVAGSIAWGAIAPSAPEGWDKAGEHIIVDSDSTTRYVVLTDRTKSGKKVKQLHPVLNFASAKLVLDKGKGEVIEVSGKDIDESPLARGATIGIPYAPDRLPSTEDAETPKEWAVCEKPGSNGQGEPQQGVFVLGGRDKKALQDKNRLGDGEALFVQDSETGDQYVVDGTGTKMMLHGPNQSSAKYRTERDLLTRLALRNPEKPQQVSTQWLKTLKSGDELTFPALDASAGTPVSFEGASELPQEAREVGKVLKSDNAANPYYYVVMKKKVQRTSPLVAKLAMGGAGLGQRKPVSVNELQVTRAGADSTEATGGKGWPQDVLDPVNRAAEGIGSTPRTVSCSVYTGRMSGGTPKLAAWAGPDYPANIVDGAASAYVSSGSGLLYREFSGRGGGGGRFLLTDSGLRYALQNSGKGDESGGDKEKDAQFRLGYEKAKIARVPQSWSALLPKGPSLDSTSASQEQGL
ncbi:type VII secretion protein EccB [Streptomyces sp. Amel2xB2]|uniref:type VII secretion protein EccB n=1 Tax=Streptomyces sp. Amel2xB2 TaxID=1305829 RepID=UPI000DB9F5C7|nr:type VII secretion protein EccB [Streptomyces sp. Amel2xB2]RAJ63559.1 type VII secretion protein EccB [Streptomyces sp. Amel2xB2]